MDKQHIQPALGWINSYWIKGLLLGAGAAAFFVVFGAWSGVPKGSSAAVFWIGIAILIMVLVLFAIAAWYLVVSPLPAGQTVSTQPIRASYRQALALLLGVGQLAVLVGGFWDEVWHRKYGIPFGEDFFWRPHMLLYFGIGVTIGLAGIGLFFLLRWGQGNLRQRFRLNPVIGLLVMAGGFLALALPADPIWHEIYGKDLSAWSVPHLLLFVSFGLVLLLATAIHMSTEPTREWRSILGLRFADALPIWMLAALTTIWYQFFTTEWDSGKILSRPEWLLPVLIAGGVVFSGVMANHTLRMPGAATLVGVLALAIRYGLIGLFGAQSHMAFHAWALAIPSLVLIDLVYAFKRRNWLAGGVAAAVGMFTLLRTIFEGFYPNNPIHSLPLTILAVLAACLGLSWLGAALGDYFAGANKQLEEAPVGWGLRAASVVAAAGFLAFIVFFWVTATPPV